MKSVKVNNENHVALKQYINSENREDLEDAIWGLSIDETIWSDNGDFLCPQDLKAILLTFTRKKLSDEDLNSALEKISGEYSFSYVVCSYLSDGSGWQRGLTVEHVNRLISEVLNGI